MEKFVEKVFLQWATRKKMVKLGCGSKSFDWERETKRSTWKRGKKAIYRRKTSKYFHWESGKSLVQMFLTIQMWSHDELIKFSLVLKSHSKMEILHFIIYGRVYLTIQCKMVKKGFEFVDSSWPFSIITYRLIYS